MRMTTLALALLFTVTCGAGRNAWANDGDEQPGPALERLGARTGVSALAVWPRVTAETKKLQRQNKYTLVVIGTDWKGGIKGLKYLKALPGVRGVMFSHKDFSDDWCGCLQGMTHMKELYVQSERFTDEGMKSLEGLKELEAVSLACTGVTDKGLAFLANKSKLQWLSLAAAYRVTDAGMVHLEDATGLRQLNLEDTQVGGDGMAHLKRATKMEWLRLSGLMFLDENGPKARWGVAGLKHLTGMKDLKYLSIGSMLIAEAPAKLMEGDPQQATWPNYLACGLATAAEVAALTDQAKGLDSIESSLCGWTRAGKKPAPTLQEKLNRVAEKLLDNIKD